MTSKEYAAKKQNIAGGIRALTQTNMPCALNCAAHPVQVQTTGLIADGMAADAEFWGNGGIDEIAEAVSKKVWLSPQIATIVSAAVEKAKVEKSEWAKPMQLPGGRSVLWTEARIWRVVIIVAQAIAALIILLASGDKVSIRDLHRLAGVEMQQPATTEVKK